MIKKQQVDKHEMKVTFAVVDDGHPVSLVGEFNGWSPDAHPLKKRSNGTRSTSVVLENGRHTVFRYLAADGSYFDDADGDGIEPNGLGQTHTLLVAEL